MPVIKLNGNAPLACRARYAEILKPREQEIVEHFVCPRCGLYEIGMRFYVLYEARRVFAETEEVAFLLDELGGRAAVGTAAVLELPLEPKRFARRAVMPFVACLVDVALLVETLEYLLDALDVVIICRAHKTVVRYVEHFPKVLECADDIVNILLRRKPLILCLALYLLAVLVGARKEINVIPHEPLIARHRVCGDGSVSVADVQLIARIIQRRCDVEFLLVVFHILPPFAYLLHISRETYGSE